MSLKKSVERIPERGDIWEADLNPTRGREQAGVRPVLIVSHDALNKGPRGLVIVLPITGTDRGFPSHIQVNPPEGRLTKPSVIMTEGVRSISTSRLIRRLGTAAPDTMNRVVKILKFMLAL